MSVKGRLTIRIHCIPSTYDFPPDAKRQQRRLLLLDQDVLHGVAGVPERVELVTRRTTATVLRMLTGEGRRNEDRGNHGYRLCASLSRERRRRLTLLGQEFDGEHRVLVGQRTESDP